MQQQLESLATQVTAIQNGVDKYGNTVVIIGNLNQTILIGATASQTGVYVGTALTGPGIAWQANVQATTVTTTAGSTSATVASGTGLVNGMVCGAAKVVGVSAIVPGTTFTISGTTLTLSIAAAETGSGLYFAACNFYALTGVTYP